jgi:hypothetical protein
VGDDGLLTPDPLAVGDYLENIDRCRRQFPELRILSGVEFGQPWIPQWWSEEGGRAITFASDAHTTDALAGNFYEAMAMAEHFGFRQGRHPEDFWTR